VWVQPADHKVVGSCLADARRHAGLTQSKLAAKLAKPQSFVSDYERGQRRIDVLEFLLIVQAMNANPLDIFGEIARTADVSR
jgi:transcriptional regulator with XRE-family HTH domain